MKVTFLGTVFCILSCVPFNLIIIFFIYFTAMLSCILHIPFLLNLPGSMVGKLLQALCHWQMSAYLLMVISQGLTNTCFHMCHVIENVRCTRKRCKHVCANTVVYKTMDSVPCSDPTFERLNTTLVLTGLFFLITGNYKGNLAVTVLASYSSSYLSRRQFRNRSEFL